MSTKSNDNDTRAWVRRRGSVLPIWNRLIADAGMQLAYFAGVAQIAERRRGGAGVILKFDHVRPPRGGAFQPLRSMEITPEFLDRVLRAIRRWGYDFLSIDEAQKRAQGSAVARRFVCLTFDGAYRDFTLYVPTGFVDGVAEAWWLALQDIVARHERIGLIIDDVEQRFATVTTDEKYQVYALLYDWLRSLPPAELSAAIGDLCKRYGVDLKKVSRDISMPWSELTKIARDPQATIASATVHYNAVAHAKSSTVLREMTMGKSVLETALGVECRHFAFPFGDSLSFGTRDILLARQAGYLSAVLTEPGVVKAGGKSDRFALPRIVWDGRRKSLTSMRTALSGIGLPHQRDYEPETEAKSSADYV